MQANTLSETLVKEDELIHRVAERLHGQIGNQLRDLRVTIRDDGLILQGRVDTYYGKQMAQELARQVSGLVVAANEIKVS